MRVRCTPGGDKGIALHEIGDYGFRPRLDQLTKAKEKEKVFNYARSVIGARSYCFQMLQRHELVLVLELIEPIRNYMFDTIIEMDYQVRWCVGMCVGGLSVWVSVWMHVCVVQMYIDHHASRAAFLKPIDMPYTHTHTHTHTYIYIYIYIYV